MPVKNGRHSIVHAGRWGVAPLKSPVIQSRNATDAIALDLRTVRGQARTFTGLAYLIQYALPNFYFHTTTAYAILRHNGIELGKVDFVGTFD